MRWFVDFLSRYLVRIGCGLLAALLFWTTPANAEKRVALVIGNSAYMSVPRLDNPRNDARLMADTLRSLGFTIVGGGPQLDLTEQTFRQVVQDFGRQLEGADVGLFYYAGHGVQVRGSNYLVPVDANPVREVDVDFQMLDANLVLLQMEGAGTKLNLVILDACRNNPLAGRSLRSAASGLATMQSPEGTLISFATQPGSVAQDGSDGHSPYTEALAQTMRKPGLDIFRTFNEVGLAVASATGGAQQPWVSLSPIRGDFYFTGPVSVNAKVTANQASPPPDPAAQAWAVTKDTISIAVVEDFIRQFGDTVYGSMARARLKELKSSQIAAVAPSAEKLRLQSERDRLTAEQAEKDQLAKEQADKDRLASEQAWNHVKDSNDPDQLRNFIDLFPNSAQRPIAEQQIALLTSGAPKSPVIPASDRHDLARLLQVELQRVGCFNGTANGEFDDASKAAWHRFVQLTSIRMPDEVSLDAINAVRGINKRVCPVLCPAGEHTEGEKCIGSTPKHIRTVVAPGRPPSRESAPAHRANGRCFSFEGKQFCQ